MKERPFESLAVFATRRLPAGRALMRNACLVKYAVTGQNQTLPTKIIELITKSEDRKHRESVICN